MRELLALLIGYLLGSVLPADLLARTRDVDIRAVGTRNPGATNALQELGWVPGLITTAYDALVGIAAMLIAGWLGVSVGWTYLAGVAAIVGHCYPVFFRFRGGQGMAATTGLLVYEMGVALSRGALTASGLLVLAVLGLAVFALTRSATLVGVVTTPLLALEVCLRSTDWRLSVFLASLTAFIFAVQLGIARRKHLFALLRPATLRLERIRHGTRH